MTSFKRLLAACAGATLACSLSTPGRADTVSAFYLDSGSNATSVKYLTLDGWGNDANGFLEAVQATGSAQNAAERSQVFAKRSGKSLTFGTYQAIRTADGYTLTSIDQGGNIDRRYFVLSTAPAINNAIGALLARLGNNRVQSDRLTGKAELRHDNSVAAAASARLNRGQAALGGAAARLTAAQGLADNLSASAAQARVVADAAMNQPGATLAQNQTRMTAMQTADDAEQNVTVAQQAAEDAASAVTAAKADLARLQYHLANVVRASRLLAARLAYEHISTQ